jgi:hypothetical protein
MTTYSSAFRTAVELTGIARAAAEVLADSFVLSAWLPSRDNYGLSYDFDVNALALATAATYRSFDTEAPFGATPGSQGRSGKLPPISRKLRVSEFDQLSLYGQTDAIGQKFEDYAEILGGQVAARVALAQGQGVQTGSITIQENKLDFTISFGRAAGHTVTAAASWALAATDIPAHLAAWKLVYIATNGYAPQVAMISSTIMGYLQANTAIIKAAVGRGTDLPAIIDEEAVRSVFRRFGYGELVINDDQVNVAGVATRVVAADRFLWLPARGGVALGGAGGTLGRTDWGIPAEAINGVYGIPESERPGIFSAAFHSNDPEGHNVLTSAIVLPVIETANATFSADVVP